MIFYHLFVAVMYAEKKWLLKSFDCITTAVWRFQFVSKYYHSEAHSTLMDTNFAVRRINVLQDKQCHLWNLVACVHSIYNRFPLNRPFEIINSCKDLQKWNVFDQSIMFKSKLLTRMNIFFLFKNSITVNLNTKQSINLTFCKTESFDQEREIRPGKS